MHIPINKVTRVHSGIEGFDKLVGGGLPAGRSYLVSGEPGTGKTIFSLQFLLNGLKNDESAVFITIDEKPEHILQDSLALGWNLQPFLANERLKIIDITKYFGSTKKNGQPLALPDIIARIAAFVSEYTPQRLVIDPIAPLILSDNAMPDVIEYIRGLIFAIEAIPNCTSLLTSYVPYGSTKVSFFGVEEFAASGIIHLKLTEQQTKRCRTISVKKMRGTQMDLSEYNFDILPERGVTLRQAL